MSYIQVGDVWRKRWPKAAIPAARRHVRVLSVGKRWVEAHRVDPATGAKDGPVSRPEAGTISVEYQLVERDGQPVDGAR